MQDHTTNNPLIKFCNCGCGQEIPPSSYPNYPNYPNYQRKFINGHRGLLPYTDRFWSKVDIQNSDRCWNWLGQTNEKNYGIFRINYRKYKAHRISWEIHFGTIPDTFLVCHKCDNPSCVNPSHLFLGTPADNTRDMIQKSRQYYPTGKRAGNTKLSFEQVSQIRKLAEKGLKHIQIAKMFEISRGYVSALINYKWRKKD